MSAPSVTAVAPIELPVSVSRQAFSCRHHVEVDGRYVSMRSYGALSARRVLFCLPGLLETQKVFHPLYSLADRDSDCLIVTMDYCGRGESGPLPSGARYRMSTYVTDVKAVLARIQRQPDGAPRQVTMVGHSMGGLIAMQVAQDPDARVSSLILNDVGTTLEWWGIYAVLARIRGRANTSEIAAELDVHPAVLRDVQDPLHLDVPYESDLWGVRFERLVAAFNGAIGLIHSESSPVCNRTIASLTKSAIPRLNVFTVAGDMHPVPWTEQALGWLGSIIGLRPREQPLVNLEESGGLIGPTGTQSASMLQSGPKPEVTAHPSEREALPSHHPYGSPPLSAEDRRTRSSSRPNSGSEARISPRPQTALVTGATSGIGLAVSRLLARAGWRVIVCGRNAVTTHAAVRRLSEEAGCDLLEGLVIELSDLDSVAAACESLTISGAPIDILINNAGCAGVRGTTLSGFEYNFGVHHVGHFALTIGLWPLLRIRPGARVVTVTSRAHRWVRNWTWDELYDPTSSLTGIVEYARSKLANILFASELARRTVGFGITSFSVHPGVLDTGIWRRLPRWLQAVNRLRLGNVRQGADEVLHCALNAPAFESGSYFSDKTVCEPSSLATNASLAQELWQRSLFWLERYPLLLDSGTELVHAVRSESTSEARGPEVERPRP